MSDNLTGRLSVGVIYSGDGSGLTAEQEEQLNKIPMIEQSEFTVPACHTISSEAVRQKSVLPMSHSMSSKSAKPNPKRSCCSTLATSFRVSLRSTITTS